MNYKVAFLGQQSPEVKSLLQEIFPREFIFHFAASDEIEDLANCAAEADFIIAGTGRVTREIIARAPTLKLIHKFGVGVDKIDLSVAEARGIPVAIIAGGNAGPVAELALALMLAVSRRLRYADSATRSGKWVKPELRSSAYQIRNKTIGLYGFGHIGKALAKLLSGFDAEIIYHDKYRASEETETALSASYVSFDDLLARSDVISLHAPLTEETRGRFGAREFAAMKRGAILVNTARGEEVDEIALCDALRTGQLRGAGIDAFSTEPPAADHPLFALDNVIVTPHAGGGVFDNVGNVAKHILRNVTLILEGGIIPDSDLVTIQKLKFSA